MGENKLFWHIFAKRGVISFFIVILMLFTCILRVAEISVSGYEEIQLNQNSLKLKIATQRGTIFDKNLIPLTNNKIKIIAAVSPTPRAITAISSVLEGEKLENTLTRLRNGKPILVEIDKEIDCEGIVCTKVYETDTANPIAIHMLGYTDYQGNGVSGIQKAYNSILYSNKDVSVLYETDGKGRLLNGVEPIIINDSSIKADGVVTTLDINIQNIAETAANQLEIGSIVISDAKSNKIRAVVNRPNFCSENIEDYLGLQDSPLLNRAINAYNVGSVFKPCVAIAGIENGYNTYCYTCTGSCEIIDRNFKCHKYDGHGYMTLSKAIANSCNTYFYNFSFNIGGDSIYKIASSLEFGKALKLCDGIETKSGSLPSIDNLKNIAHLANFSIGQGELLLSPISILTLYSAIAYDGAYYIPSIVEGTIQNGSFNKYDTGNRTRVMKKETAEILKEYLKAVLSEGTGLEANPETVSAAGKTATAQTGKYQNGVEICEGWFCGYFPAESPKYVVIIFSENITRQSKSCSRIFAQIADQITELENH